MPKLTRYARSTAKWIAAGMPERTDQQVATLLEICQRCEWYTRGSCGQCGCRCNSGGGWRNKLRRATESCPVGKWPQDLTIVYYSSNREDEQFEARIVTELLAVSNGLPIISVTQKPMDLGRNICVGDVGTSAHNCRRQFLIGCQAATTAWVASAESDFPYPPGHFATPAASPGIYSCDNIRIIWHDRGWTRLKKSSDGAIIADRQMAIVALQKMLGDTEWIYDGDSDVGQRKSLTLGTGRISNAIPCVSFKSGRGMSYNCPHKRGTAQQRIEHWGHVDDLKRKVGL